MLNRDLLVSGAIWFGKNGGWVGRPKKMPGNSLAHVRSFDVIDQRIQIQWTKINTNTIVESPERHSIFFAPNFGQFWAICWLWPVGLILTPDLDPAAKNTHRYKGKVTSISFNVFWPQILANFRPFFYFSGQFWPDGPILTPDSGSAGENTYRYIGRSQSTPFFLCVCLCYYSL